MVDRNPRGWWNALGICFILLNEPSLASLPLEFARSFAEVAVSFE